MLGRIDIHGYEERLKAVERKLEQSNPISEKDAKVLRRFEAQLLREGLSAGRVTKYLHHLRRIAELLGKPLEEATRVDIEDVVLK